MKDAFIFKTKKNGSYIGFCDSSHPVSSPDTNVIYIELTDGQYQKLISGWRPILDLNDKVIGMEKPQWVTDQENLESRIKTLKQKLKDGMATQVEKDELLLLIA